MLIVVLSAEAPLQVAIILSRDELGGGNAGLYANGPVQSGGCSGSAETENAIILACANFYPIAVAIREEAAVVLDLDLNEEAEAFLANLFAILFLTCYFADYPEHVNIWLVGKGELPIDFGGSMSQTSGIVSQMNDLFAENAGSFQKQINLGKLNKFALDTTPKSSYNSSGSGTNSQQSSSSTSSGVDIGELNPIRYRGYYYDVETEYYFLQTRYYSPQWRRFINADVYFIAGDDVLNAANMYAYCNGNPVMLVDPNGTDAYLVIDYNTGKGGLAVVGHSRLLLQDSAGTWWMTEFTGFNKKDARIYTRPATNADWARAKEPVNITLTKGASNVLIKGNFTKGLELAKKYAQGNGKSFGPYAVIGNNCLHYVLKILGAGTFADNALRNAMMRANLLTTIPSVYFAKVLATGNWAI